MTGGKHSLKFLERARCSWQTWKRDGVFSGRKHHGLGGMRHLGRGDFDVGGEQGSPEKRSRNFLSSSLNSTKPEDASVLPLVECFSHRGPGPPLAEASRHGSEIFLGRSTSAPRSKKTTRSREEICFQGEKGKYLSLRLNPCSGDDYKVRTGKDLNNRQMREFVVDAGAM